MIEDLTKKYPYLQYLDRPLDNQQLKVCCRTENTVVAAGAGSGKTQVLATRFAFLVMEFDDISASSILTLTFTKKAAAEMYSRIYKTLKKFAYDENIEIPERQRKNAIRALNEFSNVHIQTLDSYCGGIVRQAANRYGIRPDFSTGSLDAERNVKNLSLSFILKNKNNPAVLHYAEAGRLQDFAENVFAKIIINYTSLATQENYFENSLKLQCKEIVSAWNENISSLKDSIFSLINVCNENKELLCSNPKYLKYVESLYKVVELEPPEFNKIQDENFIENQNEIILEYLNQISDYLSKWNNVQKFGNVRAECVKNILKPAFEELKNKILPFFNSLIAFVLEYSYAKEMFRLLDEFSIKINSIKRNTGFLTFNDVSQMALKILIEQKDIRRQEKNTYKKIMIDEFQDNNGSNRDLLYILSESGDEQDFIYDENSPESIHQVLKEKIVKDKLFFVGDEKQSIYKFRGADVSVFNELKKDLEIINGSESFIPMIYNYRSKPELLTSFNTLFGGFNIKNDDYTESNYNSIFLNDSENNFEALYSKSAIARYVDKISHEELKPVKLDNKNIRTHIAIFLSDSNFSSLVKQNLYLNEKNQIAYYIAKKIFELHSQKKIKFSQIAYLDKSRTDRTYLISWLEHFNIPYQLDQQSNLFADAPVNDIYNFLRLCVYPSDLNAFSAFICSPFVGLSELDLEKILSIVVDIKNKDFVFIPFDEKYENQIKQALEENSIEFERYLNAKKLFLEKQKEVLSQPITKTLNFLWYEQGYRYETILNKNLNSFEEQYDLLFEIAKNADLSGKSISWFVDQLANQKENAFFGADSDLDTKEVSYPLERTDAIQIMTIHKSKGLQFDYVFAAGCLGKEKSETEMEPFYFDNQFGVSLKPKTEGKNYFFLKLKEKSDAKNFAEFRRLIYVAATRAVEELYFVGGYKLKKDGTFSEFGPFEGIVSQYYPNFSESDFEKSYEEDSPFELIKIPHQSTDVYFEKQIQVDELRSEKIKKADNWIKNANIIQMPILESNNISPSNLELPYNEEKDKILRENQKSLVDLYPEIDEILTSLEKSDKNFNFDKFGTLVHFYLEQVAKNVSYIEIKNLALDFLKKLDKKYQDKLDEICIKICERFYHSNFGLEIVKAKSEGRKVVAEQKFTSFMNSKFVTGSIDLYFENKDGCITIIDYKTDHVINVEKYKEQQLCYKNAICDFYEISEEKVKCFLYFIRFDIFKEI